MKKYTFLRIGSDVILRVSDGTEVRYALSSRTHSVVNAEVINITEFGDIRVDQITSINGELPGSNATDVVAQITESGSGGSGLTLESYENSAMSTAVMAYVFRDEEDNIYRVYEPIKNNDVSRSAYAYAESIDQFRFDAEHWYNNRIIDMKLTQPGGIDRLNGNQMETIVVKGGTSGNKIEDNYWKGHYGLTATNGIDIEFNGVDSQIYGNNVWYGGYIEDIGDECAFYYNTMYNMTEIAVGGQEGCSVSKTTMFDESYITFNNIAGYVTNCSIGNGAGIEIVADSITVQNCEVSPAGWLNAGFNVTTCNIGTGASLEATGGTATNISMGNGSNYVNAGNVSMKNIIRIGVTSYEFGEDAGAATLTAV